MGNERERASEIEPKALFDAFGLFQQALYASKIVSYAQGFMLMREAAKEFNWTLNYGGIALMWRGGCIIRRLVNKTKLQCSIHFIPYGCNKHGQKLCIAFLSYLYCLCRYHCLFLLLLFTVVVFNDVTFIIIENFFL